MLHVYRFSTRSCEKTIYQIRAPLKGALNHFDYAVAFYSSQNRRNPRAGRDGDYPAVVSALLCCGCDVVDSVVVDFSLCASARNINTSPIVESLLDNP